VDAVSTPAPSPASPAAARAAAPYDVGIAGAGQLARMTALAAWPVGISVAVLGRPGEPAAGMAAGLVEGDWRDASAVAALGAASRVVTLENEFVDPDALVAAAGAGATVRPAPEDLAVVQDKALQKARLAEAGLAVPDFLVLRAPGEVAAAGRDLGWPLMLKARRLGYDGYGNATCRTTEEASEALARLDAGDGVLAERMVPFERELAVMVARGPGGEALPYPVTETRQRDHVCHEVLVPAPVAEAVARAAADLALAAAEAAGGVGVTGVELFLADGRVMVNEIAPRPHNSGHYSIEACETSQFESHLRGVLGLPLGDVALRAPAAAMVNLLGDRAGPAAPDLRAALAVPGAHVHLYGKADVRPRRKMGHVTALGATPEEALARARAAAGAVRL
jgi:5-(carboxyamino)imidazole ribonucleotide synthase